MSLVTECALALAAGLLAGIAVEHLAMPVGVAAVRLGRIVALILVTLLGALALSQPIAAADWSTTTAPRANPAPARSERQAAPPPAANTGRPARTALNDQQLFLIRSTLMTLADANRTGNYAVLRALSSPTFQTRYTEAELERAFAAIRRQNVDLAVVALVRPELSASPTVEPGRLVRLAGAVPAGSYDIGFELSFAAISGHWRLDGISLARLDRK